MNEYLWNIGGMLLTGESQILGENTVPVPLSTTNPTLTGLGMNLASAIMGQ